jgi:hypothetical protein
VTLSAGGIRIGTALATSGEGDSAQGEGGSIQVGGLTAPPAPTSRTLTASIVNNCSFTTVNVEMLEISLLRAR